jgi:hypothetical protein
LSAVARSWGDGCSIAVAKMDNISGPASSTGGAPAVWPLKERAPFRRRTCQRRAVFLSAASSNSHGVHPEFHGPGHCGGRLVALLDRFGTGPAVCLQTGLS